MKKLKCDLYHEFDGQCCAPDEPCMFVDQRRPLPASEVARISAGMHRDVLAVLVGLTIVFGLGGWALVTLESQQKRQDTINQEQLTWK